MLYLGRKVSNCLTVASLKFTEEALNEQDICTCIHDDELTTKGHLNESNGC